MDVRYLNPGTAEISMPPPREKARYFGASVRFELSERLRRRALREGGHLFMATEDGDLAAFGATQFHKVLSMAGETFRLSDSHAAHRRIDSSLSLDTGRSYEMAIDPATNIILEARPTDRRAQDVPRSEAFSVSLESLPRLDHRGITAEALFSRLARQPHIPFQYLGNGCQGRAHEMCRLIERHLDQKPDDIVAKLWNVGEGTIEVATDNSPDCRVEWFFHVAPVVNMNGSPLVLDPGLFPGPVPPETWLARQRTSAVTRQYPTSRHAFAPSAETEGLFVAEMSDQSEEELQRYRDALASQIFCRGPLPYPCRLFS